MDLKELGIIKPDRHWYYSAKATAILRATTKSLRISGNIVDVGAGSGFFAQRVKEAWRDISVICYDPFYSEDQVGVRDGISYQSNLSSSELQDARLVLMIDVLEHIDNDGEFLSKIVRDVSDGTVFIITVPAFRSLWGKHDEFLGHYRRYRLGELIQVVSKAGLVVDQRRYLFRFVFPVVWLIRKLQRHDSKSDLSALPIPVNALLRLLCTFDNLLPSGRVPGVTAMVVARAQRVSG